MQHLAGGLYYRACLERSNAWDWHGVRSGGSACKGVVPTARKLRRDRQALHAEHALIAGE